MGNENVKIKPESIYLPSPKMVVRNIEEEIVIIPIEGGLADLENEMFSLNRTGLAIWNKLDINNTVDTICQDLIQEFDSAPDQMKCHVMDFLEILLEKNIIFEYSKE